MRSIVSLLVILSAFVSCSKEELAPPEATIPDVITGYIIDVKVTPANINTPDKGLFTILANGTVYNVNFNTTEQAQSNAQFKFASDSILTGDSREFANLGKDEVAYNPVAANEIEIRFTNGKKVLGVFEGNTTFGGVFGEQMISQWRTPNNPSMPNQKAKDDIRNFVRRYADKDGPGPGISPNYLFVTVSQR